MDFALPTALAALVLLVVYALVRGRGRRRPEDRGPESRDDAVVILDVAGTDANSPSVRRLVQEVARNAFSQHPDLAEVTVLSRVGSVLGRVSALLPEPHLVDFPPLSLLEPHIARTPSEPAIGVEGAIKPKVFPRFDTPERPAPRRPFAESFDLPDEVRRNVSNPDDPLDVVRAILASAGLPVEISDDLLRCGDAAIIVLPAHGVVPFASLNHSYFRFRESGAKRGLVIALGFMDPTDIRKREAFVPEFKHVGPKTIQRMADAVSVGADPLSFAVAPPVLERMNEEDGRRAV